MKQIQRISGQCRVQYCIEEGQDYKAGEYKGRHLYCILEEGYTGKEFPVTILTVKEIFLRGNKCLGWQEREEADYGPDRQGGILYPDPGIRQNEWSGMVWALECCKVGGH